MNIENLKMARELAGLSQSQLANQISISLQRYNNFERGFREPDNQLLVELADALNVSTDFLLRGGKGKMEKQIFNIVFLRRLAGMTPRAFEETFGTAKKVLVAWENGTFPKEDFIQMAANFFGVTIEFITGSNFSLQNDDDIRDFQLECYRRIVTRKGQDNAAIGIYSKITKKVGLKNDIELDLFLKKGTLPFAPEYWGKILHVLETTPGLIEAANSNTIFVNIDDEYAPFISNNKLSEAQAEYLISDDAAAAHVDKKNLSGQDKALIQQDLDEL
jgi:transcriptional regulator with XRE-family HTH domain